MAWWLVALLEGLLQVLALQVREQFRVLIDYTSVP